MPKNKQIFESYESSDGWLLATLYCLKKPATRSQVINTGDALNHDVFSDEEIDLGILRLELGGLAWHKDRHYGITPRGRLFAESKVAVQSRQDFIGHMLHLMHLMHGMEIDVVNDLTEER